MRKLLFVLTTLTLLSVAALAIVWDRFASFLASPSASARTDRVVTVPPGATNEEVIGLLATEGLLDRPELLAIYLDHFAKEFTIHPGEYALSSSLSPVEIMRRLASGKVVTYKVTIPPGSDAIDVAKILAAMKLGEEAELKKAAFDRGVAGALSVPSISLEGYLFPDTYELPRNLTPQALLGVLVQRYRQLVQDGVLKSTKKKLLTENETITLASLVEKADVVPNERRLYAALLHNRLKTHYALESKASIRYGLKRAGVSEEDATKAQLDHAWNTDLNDGLPPTPICSPGLASIVAASEPTSSRAMFMVKRSDGTHVFCDDEDCYRAALKEWQPELYAPHKKKKRAP